MSDTDKAKARASFSFWRQRWIGEGRPRDGYTYQQLLSAQGAMNARVSP